MVQNKKIDCGKDWVEVLSEENLTGVFFSLRKKKSAKFAAIVMYRLEVSLTQHLAAVFCPLQATSDKFSQQDVYFSDLALQMQCFLNLWIYLMYPSGKERRESVHKGEAEPGR